MSTQLHGIAASDGIAVAPAFVLSGGTESIEERHDISVKDELARFDEAVEKTNRELSELYETAHAKLGADHAQIFTAHAQMLEDPEFAGAIQSVIETEQVNAEYALDSVSKQLISIFEQMDNEYMRQRSSDIRDLSQRVFGHLLGSSRASLASLQEPVVLVAQDLAPSDTIMLDKNLVLAFITGVGGRTSHSAIMARSLGIPAVVGLGSASETIHSGDVVIVNGFEGDVIVGPTPDELASFQEQSKTAAIQKQRLLAVKDEPTITLDGHTVELAGNIGTPKDVEGVLENGGEGIGLFRSEFLYMNQSEAPTEQEQFDAYRQVAKEMAGKPVIVRTLDVGGDKEIPYLELPKEANPFLGYRAIRVCLDRTDLFKTQLRAILRASHYGKIKIMFPMISNIDEIRRAKQMLEAAKQELRDGSIPFDENLEVGIMVEIPSSAVAADLLAKEVDFFSIGTNDLIQYTLACDRMNERISHLYQPYHPAILRLIKMVIDGAHKHGKWVGMCGEMAGDITAAPILLGLGLDEFSMSASSILKVRQLIRNLSFWWAEALAIEAIEQDSQEAVRALVSGWTG